MRTNFILCIFSLLVVSAFSCVRLNKMEKQLARPNGYWSYYDIDTVAGSTIFRVSLNMHFKLNEDKHYLVGDLYEDTISEPLTFCEFEYELFGNHIEEQKWSYDTKTNILHVYDDPVFQIVSIECDTLFVKRIYNDLVSIRGIFIFYKDGEKVPSTIPYRWPSAQDSMID